MNYDLQIHLSIPDCSGRAVRLRKLTPSEKDAASVAVAKMIGPDGIAIDYSIRETREIVERALVSVTRKRDLTDAEVADEATEWVDLDQKKLGFDRDDPLHYDNLFTAKDDGVLCQIVNRWLRATPADVDAIMGKALRGCRA